VILLWGVPGDGPLDSVAAALRTLSVPWRLLDQRGAGRSVIRARVARGRFVLKVQSPAPVHGNDCGPTGCEPIDFDAVGAFYLRPVETERALSADSVPAPALLCKAQAVEQAIVEWADSAPALIWMCDEDGALVFANRWHEETFGRPVTELMGEG